LSWDIPIDLWKGEIMSETTQTPQLSAAGGQRPRRRFWRRALIATVLAAGATGLAITAFAHGGGRGGWHRGGFLGGPLDPAALDQRVDRMLKHLYVEIDATDAQKQQLAPIVKDAARDLLPLQTRLRDGRRQAIEFLSQQTIDRAALEALRADQLMLAEQLSKRITQALADVADVLTPEQRRQVAERIGRWRRG
jgi:periplasmic protein CpxP/Spy